MSSLMSVAGAGREERKLIGPGRRCFAGFSKLIHPGPRELRGMPRSFLSLLQKRCHCSLFDG